ncbi:hypothetical protein NUH30_19115 [Leptospira sp. 85282-16]|uniref:hypothetical protein n=1 Tax=Leptospira sp. 85282-16 TaxID=2971256 RepID=UPI0021BEEB11|nr:hypothetical protein [Leptospira sp. 85282-16]MCT8335805.1 hypothetical protein [Leptospira sp. 85282-16]
MKDESVSKIINTLHIKTELGNLKWNVIKEYPSENNTLSSYITNNASFSKSVGIKSISNKNKYYQLQISQSYYCEFSSGIIYLFYYYVKEFLSDFNQELKEAIIASSNRRELPPKFNINLILAIQPDLNSQISELNVIEENQEDLRRLYVIATRNTNKNFDFINNLINN